MAGTSISSQLQAIKSILNVSADPEPSKRRPLTRPSILFDPKAAADIDIDAILSIAISGLEVLISSEERFRSYQSDLFSHNSRELDRELVGVEENKRINLTIGSYLRLLSGHLESHAALKTLEYLIRRYKVHVYNAEELILCALPYHDTHVFVQIVQLIDTGNTRWKFLDGVKTSGARPPREVIVQQCIRDMGVLEAICNYATPAKKIQPSKQVTGFCTAVVFEVLGIVSVDSDTVKRILPYVSSGLQPSVKAMDQRAGALMIVSLLAQKATLATNVVNSLMRSVAEIAKADAKNTADFQWLRMSLMALISIVQLQSVRLIPKKTVDLLSEIRDIPGILAGLTTEFEINKFLTVFLKSLIQYCSDDQCCHTLLSMIDIIPMKDYVNHIVSKLVTTCMQISQDKNNSISTESGSQGNKQVLISICEKYPNESRGAFNSVLKSSNVSKKVSSSYDALCKLLESSPGIPDPKIYFALEHSEAEMRRSAVLGLDIDEILRNKAAGSKKFDATREALLHRLYDDDLNVVLAVLNLKNFSEILSSPLLIDALQHILQRCIDISFSSSSANSSLAVHTAISCLQLMIENFKDQEQYAMTLASTVFPLVLIRPKVSKLNLKALELAKVLKWPFFKNLVTFTDPEKELISGSITSYNTENIRILADAFSSSPDEYIPWLVECCNSHKLSKTLFFLVLMQSLEIIKMDATQFSAFFNSCFPFLKTEWGKLESKGISAHQFITRILDSDSKGILDDLVDTNNKDLDCEILACLFLRLSEAFIATAPKDEPLDMKGEWVSTLQDLFLFFASHSKDIFKKHLEYVVTKCKTSLMHITLKMFTEEGTSYSVQVESLHSFSHLCSQSDEGLAIQLLTEFPSILVPLSSDNKDVQVAAMTCIEDLYSLWLRFCKNGNKSTSLHFLGELLLVIIQQKKMILSDKNFVLSFFTSLLGPSSHSLLVQQDIGKRFNVSTKDDILVFIVSRALGHSSYAKLKILSLLRGLGIKLIHIAGVKSLLNDLLERRSQNYLENDKLSKSEVEILCLLLESGASPISSHERHDFGDYILKALQLNGAEDSSVVEPCKTILRNLSNSIYLDMTTETQELIFRHLLILFRSNNGDIQNATRETLLRINIHCSVVERVLDSILNHKACSVSSTHKKRKKSAKIQNSNLYNDVSLEKEMTLSFVSSFLDVLLMKKNIENRTSLVGPLFKLLDQIFMNDEWILRDTDQDKENTPSADATAYIQHTLLLTLEDISVSILNDIPSKDIPNFDLQLLVNCARSSSDAVTRNHVFSLITSLAKFMPDKVLDQILPILTAIGESTVTQWDSYSQRVFESLISAVVPCWLSRTDNADELLQIFVNLLPQVAEHRRLSIIIHILRTLGETTSLGSLLFLLVRSLISRESLLVNLEGNAPSSLGQLTLLINKQWEYGFALQLLEQFSCSIWLPSVNAALQKIGRSDKVDETFAEILVAVQFVGDKLRDPEIAYKLDIGDNSNQIQNTVGELMEHIVSLLQLVDSRKKHTGVPAVLKNGLKDYIRIVLKTVTKRLLSSTYFNVITKLVRHVDKNVRKKALGLLRETVKEFGSNANSQKGSNSSSRNSFLHLNETSSASFNNLCLEILTLLETFNDASNTSLKLSAVSSLEVLSNSFPSQDSVFTTCLGSVSKRISSDNSALACHCLRATGALVNALGPRALPELPTIMESVLKKCNDVGSLNSTDEIFTSILVALEAVIDKLGAFLTPYLGDILKLVMLHPLAVSNSELKLKLKADFVRRLICVKIPVRLLLQPVLAMYSDAIKSGESSLSVLFEILRNLVGPMDRSSILAYHAKIFDSCLLALDIRRQNPPSIKNIEIVEKNVIDAIIALTMKLTETMFRPLFIKTIEWSGSNLEDDENNHGRTIDRAISFYGLVDKLAENHRSLFVPYFKYLLEGGVRYLVDSEDTKSGPTQKKKKAKLINNTKEIIGALSPQMWHLRTLILSSLQKCFLYDTGSLKFLDSANFQVLIKPLVSQLVMDPPSSIENHLNLPSVKEVDDLLVSCVGQMAVTAGSDLLWKPLNHEVLMQTRSEKVRARILGLRIIKYFVENLKEEYLVFLPETIPFLGELLEDMELPVKSLAQEILKEMETLSGESLRDYL